MSGAKMLKRLVIGAAVISVAGCSLFEDDEEILPGERIPVRATVEERTASPEVRARVGALPAPLRNEQWTQRNGGPTHAIGHIQAGSSLSVAWSADIGSGGGSDSILTGAPVVAGGKVFTLDAASKVSAFSTSGAKAWSVNVAPEGESGDDGFGGGLAYEGGRLFVTTGFGDTIALDASNGGEIWRQRIGAPIRSAPSVAAGIVISIGRDNTAYAYSAADGAVRWRVRGAASGAGVLGGASAAISPGGTAIIPFGSGEVIAVGLQNGRRTWSDVVSGGRRGLARSAISDISADPVIQGVAVIAGNSSGLLVGIDGRSGRRGWSREFGAMGPVWSAGPTMFLLTDDAQLKRLSAQDGATLWSTTLPQYDDPEDLEGVIRYGGPVLAGGRLLVTSADGRLLSFNPETGEEIGRIEISGLTGIGPVVAGGTVYLLTDGGSLIALR